MLRSNAYVSFEILDADIDAFDHHQEVVLHNETVSGMVEHMSGILELLEILQPLLDRIRDLNQPVLPFASRVRDIIQRLPNGTHSFFQHSFTCSLQTLTPFFDSGPVNHHLADVLVHLRRPLKQGVACTEMARHGVEICPKVRLL